MNRPDFVTNEQIIKWSENIENDEYISPEFAEQPLLKEVLFASLFLAEELEKLNCPNDLITRIQYTAGAYSYGADPWEISQEILNNYKNNKLIFE